MTVNSGGSAQAVSTQAATQQGGPAQPVYVVSGGTQEGGPAQPVYVVTSGPVAGGPALPVYAAAIGSTVAGGPAVPVYVVSGSLSGSANTVGAATVAAMNTTVTNDLSPDGITWAAVRGSVVVDQYGKMVVYAQRYNANTRLCYFVISNDSGATWADNTGIVGGEGFLTRGDIVYDAARDCFHGLIMATNPSDGGIIYRRYSITRDGSNNITSIARVGGVSVVLDDAGADNNNALEFPTIIMPDSNTLLAAWTIRTTSPGGEIRCCKCNITSNADAGGTASNWVHIGVNSTTTIGSPPAVASYTIPFTQGTAASIPYFSILQLVSGDLRWVYYTGATANAYATRRSVRNAAVTWNTLSIAVTITNVQRSGTDTGYSLKSQLISQQSERAGVVFVGLATWKSNAAGDTWGVYAIAANDSVATSVDVYSAGGAHSYAPTGDCAYDNTANRIVVTYDQTTTVDGYIGLLNPADLSTTQAFAAFETSADVDIPVIGSTRMNGRVLIVYRVAGSPPQIGKTARLVWQ
jgi:hypothetical protein